MAKRFPMFKTHETASCFNCDGDFGLGYWTETDNAANSGRYRQDCVKCGMATYYDISDKP